MKLTIAGAGVAGLCCAYELARRGHDVTVYEMADSLNQNSCSYFAGGMLAPWCERESAEEQVLTLGKQAIDWWAGITNVTRGGTLVVAPQRDAAELTRFARRTCGHEPADVKALEPALGQRRGLFFAGEAHLDPRQALQDLARECTELGVVFHFGAPAQAAVDVNCTGLAANLPGLRPVRGEMLYIRSRDVVLTRTVRLLHPRFPVYVVPRGDGVHMVGATMIESNAAGPVTLRSMMELLGALYTLHPGFAEAEILETGTGLRPAFCDNLPRVQRVGSTWHVNGLYRHGYLLAPAMAQQLADRICEEVVYENYG
jgi:glycine oxidase